MMSDVFSCSIDVLRCFWCSQDALICSQMCSRCVQMISDVRICFQKITNVMISDFPLIFSRCSQDVLRILPGFSQDVLMGLVSVMGLVGLIGWVGLEGLVSLVGIFFLFDLIQKYFQMEFLSFMIHKNLMIPKTLVV